MPSGTPPLRSKDDSLACLIRGVDAYGTRRLGQRRADELGGARLLLGVGGSKTREWASEVLRPTIRRTSRRRQGHVRLRSRCGSGSTFPKLPELCDYLLGRGWAAVEVGLDEANVLARWAPSDFEAAIMLLADVDLWRAQRPWTHVTVNPHVTG